MAAPIVIQAQLDMSRMRADVATVSNSVGAMSPNKIYKEMSRAADVFVSKIQKAKIGGGGSFAAGLLSGTSKYLTKIGEAKLAWQAVYDAQIKGGASVADATNNANQMQAQAVAAMAGGFSKLQAAASVLAARLGGGAGVAGALGVAAAGAGALFLGFKGVSAIAGGIGGIVGGIGSAFTSITGVISSVGSALTSAFSFVWDIGAEIVSSIGGALSYVGGLIGDTFSSAFGYVRDIVGGVFSWMKNTVFSAVGAWLGTVSLGVGVLAIAGARLGKSAGATKKADDDPTKDFGFLQNVIEKSGDAIGRFIDKVQMLVGGWFAGSGDLVGTAAGYLSNAIDWVIPKLQSVIVSVLTGVLKVISIADSIAGAVYALFSGDFAAAGAMVINAAVKVVEAMQGIITMLAPQINWIVSKVAMLAGGVLSLVAKGFAYIESPLKNTLGFVMNVSVKIYEAVVDIVSIANELVKIFIDIADSLNVLGLDNPVLDMTKAVVSGVSQSIENARGLQNAGSLAAEKMTGSASSGTWAVALESAAKSIGDSGAAGIDAAGAMNGVLGDLNTWLKGVSTNLDSGAESKFGGLLNPAKDAIEKLIETLGGGSILGADAPGAADAEKQKGATSVDSIDSVVGSIKVGADVAADLQKKTVTEQKKTNVLLGQISNKSGALT